MSTTGRSGGLFERIKRLVTGRPEPVAEPVTGTLFTATRFPSSTTPEVDEPLFADAPARQAREPDLWDSEPLVGPDEAGPGEGGPDERGLEELGPEPGPVEDDGHPPVGEVAPHHDDVTVAALTDELSRLVDEDGDDLDLPTADVAPPPAPEALFAARAARPQPAAGSGPSRAVTEDRAEVHSDVNVHGERLDTRPGPIRMTPSEALALAKDGPAALRHRRRPS